MRWCICVFSLLFVGCPIKQNIERPKVVHKGPGYAQYWKAAQGQNVETHVAAFKKYILNTPEIQHMYGWVMFSYSRLDREYDFEKTLQESLEKWIPKINSEPTQKKITEMFQRFEPSQIRPKLEKFAKVFGVNAFDLSIYAIPSLGACGGRVRIIPKYKIPQEKEVVIVYGVDTMAVRDLHPDVFFDHELFHAYQALLDLKNPPKGRGEYSIFNPLHNEGMAVMGSALLNPKLPTSALIGTQETTTRCEGEYKKWAGLFLEDYKKIKSEKGNKQEALEKQLYSKWFLLDSKATDVPKEAGYCLGWKAVESLIKKGHPLKEIVLWKPSRVYQALSSVLRELSTQK